MSGVLALAALALSGCGLMVRLEPEPNDPGECAEASECDDGIDCTRDECDPEGKCASKSIHELCLAEERCDRRAGCIPRRACEADADCRDADPCNGAEACDPEGFCASGEPLRCDDGVFCNGDELCRPGSGCEPGTARNCSDGIDCTRDSCNEGSRECVSAPDDSLCDDGEYCDGAESCAPDEGCRPGAVPCDDGIDCTDDQCVEERDACLYHGVHERCDPGELCWPTDDGFECTEVPCDPISEEAQCDDLDGCNGIESCANDGSCRPGIGLPCDDGIFCNGAEFCDGWCRSQEPPSCFDGVDCTLDVCDAVDDQCVGLADDLLCDDGQACTAESCSPVGCDRSAVLCDDGVACTLDYCSEERGGCTQDTPDQDVDGHGDESCGGDDCDDLDPFVSPGADELCNGLDENCDTLPDDGFECGLGDGRPCDTRCQSTGWQSCFQPDCTWGDCVEPPEDCNGVDDDCDETVDENCDCVPGDPDLDCQTPCGTTGTHSCGNDGRWGPCIAPEEECNGADDDCNGERDESFECELGTMELCPPSCLDGGDGARTCAVDCTWGPCVPPIESCNGLDDDCNDEADDVFACVQGSSEPCMPGCDDGGEGVRTCSAQCTWGVCVAPVDECNGLDDDCSGICDDAFSCCANQPFGTCLTTCNTIGAGRCDPNCEVDADVCDPPEEVCNGRDDDCDDGPDDGFACAAFIDVQNCAGGNGVLQGRQRCDVDCAWGPCCTASELCSNWADDDCDGETDEADCCAGPIIGREDYCDGVDDDCDGLCDEDGGDGCCMGESAYCVTECSTIGWRFCLLDAGQFPARCVWDACQPPLENCQNGYDDDCDGDVDGVDHDCIDDPA